MFRSKVPAFDGNVSLGRRHDRRVNVDSPEELMKVLERLGIEKALVYNPYAVAYDGPKGNGELVRSVREFPRLVPQFVVNFCADELEGFKDSVEKEGIRSLRAYPKAHTYPFVPWLVGEWMEWMGEGDIPLWLPIDEVDIKELYETAAAYPRVKIVLVGVHYIHHVMVCHLVERLPNLYVELSRYCVMRPVERFIERFGPERLIFGSGLPDMDAGANLYYLHNCGIENDILGAVCRYNLEGLLYGAKKS